MSTHRILVPEGAVCSSGRSAAIGVSKTPANNLFLDAMLEMPTTNEGSSRKPLKMAASILIHTAVLALLVIIPVFFANNSILLENLTPTYVFTPPPPMAPPPPAAAARARAVQVAPKIAIPTPAVVAPHVIPKQTSTVADNAAAPAVDPGAGVMGGVEGGVPGGVLGGILGGTGGVAGPPVPTTPQGIVRVGGSVRPPELVDKVQPEYPAVARAARVEGVVIIDAVIDKDGNVVSEHAVSGSNLLVAAALAAVEQWKYQPTYLNGQPVELAMQVTVAFNLNT